ncbi:transcriptional regulator, AraC family [Kordiimonas lacus]|uniref:Transcriptional regulator, AraC family n=2 Tax=Kordiimonas lacus TaxID=637679 RepID=A0A1G6T3Q8_9PROT|nr:transcriptional regulator, AraC family [Kordiimonas lacus]
MTDERIKRVLFYIEQNIAEPLSLEALADVACLSPHHFHRLFTSEVGQTPKGYVVEVRLKHIAHMLIIMKNAKVTDFAFDFGFSSPAAFTRSFKAFYGETPREFRARQQEMHKARLEVYWASLREDETWAPHKLDLTHMPQKTVKAVRTAMTREAINDTYRSLIGENQGKVTHALTIYTESPFGPGREKERLFVGLDTQAAKAGGREALTLQAGYYTQLPVRGDFDALADTLFKVYQRDIEPTAYKVASTIFFERVRLPKNAEDFDYFSSERIIHACITRR